MLNKKTLLILALSLTFLLTAAACGGPDPVEPSLSGDTQPSETVPDSEPAQDVPAAEPSPLPDSGTPAVVGDFLSLPDADLMAFMLEQSDGAETEAAQYELGERLLARPGDVLAAMEQYVGYTIGRWTYSGDGAQWLAEALASEFAVMRGGADDAALQTALDGQSGAMAELLNNAINAHGPAGIAQRIYDWLVSADQITVTLTTGEGTGTWTGRPDDFGLVNFVGDWEWAASNEAESAGGGAVSAAEWTLTVSAGDASIQFYSGSTAAACTLDGELSVLYAIPLCPDRLGELMYTQALELPLG